MFKRHLHVLILRSSSGSTYCSLPKLYANMIILYYIFQWCSSILCVCVFYPLQRGQSTDLPARDTTYTHTNDMMLHHRNR